MATTATITLTSADIAGDPVNVSTTATLTKAGGVIDMDQFNYCRINLGAAEHKVLIPASHEYSTTNSNKLYIKNLSETTTEFITVILQGSTNTNTGIEFGKLYAGQWLFMPYNQNDASALIEVSPSVAGIDIEYAWIHENVDILADD